MPTGKFTQSHIDMPPTVITWPPITPTQKTALFAIAFARTHSHYALARIVVLMVHPR